MSVERGPELQAQAPPSESFWLLLRAPAPQPCFMWCLIFFGTFWTYLTAWNKTLKICQYVCSLNHVGLTVHFTCNAEKGKHPMLYLYCLSFTTFKSNFWKSGARSH